MPLLAVAPALSKNMEKPMIRKMHWLTAILVVMTLAACQSTPPAMTPVPAKVTDGTLADPNGMTLYTFAKDVSGSGRSECSGACANLWPPFTAGANAQASGNWSLIKRDDGTMQWAYKGKPLYTYAKDTKPGDKNGHNYNSMWFWATE
jgi:predicted lipoprotein with Yx(FWY)xxD motif